jgi:hypothetical protein
MPTPSARSTSTALHTHFGALIIGGTFLGVLLAGTLWRLSAAHMVTSSNPTLRSMGEAMAVQY